MRKVLLMAISLTMAVPALAGEQAAFSPGGALDLVLATIGGARQTIEVAAYSFTSKPIAGALVAASKRGVKVWVVADQKANGGRYSAVTYLANQGVPVRLDSHYAIMHNKFMVVDGQVVETGSFNYTAGAANKNAENVLVLGPDKALADTYAREWRRLWDESTDMAARY